MRTLSAAVIFFIVLAAIAFALWVVHRHRANAYSERMPNSFGRVCGRISMPDRGTVLNGVVVLRRVGKEQLNSAFGAVSADGTYCTDPVPPGKYWVGAQAGGPCGEATSEFDGYYPRGLRLSEAKPVEVKGGADTTNVSFALVGQPRSTLRGRVVPEYDLPVPLGSLRVALVDSGQNPHQGQLDKGLEPDGSFAFYCVTPGRYRLTIFGVGDRTIEMTGKDQEIVFKISRVD